MLICYCCCHWDRDLVGVEMDRLDRNSISVDSILDIGWLVLRVLVISDMNSDEAESRAVAGPGQGSTGLQCYYFLHS